jgi:hypothetical protein
MIKLPNASSVYGASMGRRDSHAADRAEVTGRLSLTHVRLNGDYDNGGAYWGGGGLPLYRVAGDDANEEIEFFLRANDRDHAKEQIRALGYVNARFYR